MKPELAKQALEKRSSYVDFENKVRGDWTLPNQRILPEFVQVRKVEVLHKDGRKS